MKQTNVPAIRLRFRGEVLREEENFVLGLPPPIFPKSFTQQYTILKTHTEKGQKLKRQMSGGSTHGSIKPHMKHFPLIFSALSHAHACGQTSCGLGERANKGASLRV